jgi:ATP-binding cassette subfamily B protein/subfamily B ATP-binding cassette protein MsbA
MKSIIRLLVYAKSYWGLIAISGVALLFITALNLITPWYVRELVSYLTENEINISFDNIKKIVIILVSAYILRSIFTYLYRYLSHVAAWRLVADMRTTVYEHLQKLSLRYYHDKQTGQLMSRTINDTATFEVLIAHAVPDLITNILVIVGVSILLFVINSYLALLTLLPIPFLVISSFIFTKKILPNFREAQGTLAELNSIVQDNISGIKEIQVFNKQKKEGKRVKKKAKNYTKAILHALKLSALFHPTVELVSSLGTVIVIGFGGYLALKGLVNAADIVAFILYLGLFYQPITTLARVVEDLQQATAGAERVFEVLDTDPDIKDKKNAVELKKPKGEIIFKNVNFSYEKGNEILKDVNFTIKPGEMMALVGPTGVGKTTIISLISRFYDPTLGEIVLDGENLKDLKLSSLRNQISIVLQDVFLFNGTIMDNIAYGTENASMEDIVESSKIARAHEFIVGMKDGYNTVIGERGIKLSGGQKQRLSIARAVLRDTPILILDEATASVDVKTEMEIQKAIQEIAGTRTIIVIAHRLSTVKKADKILVLKEGKVVEEGTHKKLIDNKGVYNDLIQFQLGS